LKTKLNKTEKVDTTIIKTTHEGRGCFQFIPEPNTKYSLEIITPEGVTTPILLPDANNGVSLIAEKSYDFGKTVTFTVTSSDDGEYLVALSKRENRISQISLHLKAFTTTQVQLQAGTFDGIHRLTVFNNKLLPIAERLIFIQPLNRIQIEVSSVKKNFTPGEPVNLQIKTKNSKGENIPSVIGVTVIDTTALKMVETRERSPRLPEMVYLENEVDHLFDAHVYLEHTVEAIINLDLLLGTQGWRRFVYNNVNSAIAGDEADKHKRMLGLNSLDKPVTPSYRGMIFDDECDQLAPTGAGKLQMQNVVFCAMDDTAMAIEEKEEQLEEIVVRKRNVKEKEEKKEDMKEKEKIEEKAEMKEKEKQVEKSTK